MDMVVESRLPADIDAQPVVQAAVSMQSELRQYQKQIEQEQRLPKTLVERMKEAGFYRLMIPHSLGGLHADPLTYLRVVELMAEGCGSVGWNLANNGVVQLVSLGLPDEACANSMRKGPAPLSQARRCRAAASQSRRRGLSRHRAVELWQRLTRSQVDAS